MKDYWRHQTIRSGHLPDGCVLTNAHGKEFPLLPQEEMGKQYGRLKIASLVVPRHVSGQRKRKIVCVQCVDCEGLSYRDFNSVMESKAGCRLCGNPRQAPKWLVSRCSGAKDRCVNVKSKRYHQYGGRGIMFKFDSPTAMAVWIMENIPYERAKQIDRIDNNGHYEPGNIRFTTSSVNQSNTTAKKRRNAFMHKFRMQYPEVRYADATIMNLYGRGMDAKQIAGRYYTVPSTKPKGLYGIFSTQDPVIASLLTTF